MGQRIQSITTTLSQRLGLDVHFYAPTFALLSLGQLSGVIRGVATTYALALWLPKETFGQFRYVLAVFGVAGMFSFTGLHAGVIRGIAQGHLGVAWAALKRTLTLSPLGSLLLILAALERWMRGEPTVALGLLLTSILFPVYASCGLYGAILTGKEALRALTFVAILNNLLFSIAFFAVIVSTDRMLLILAAYIGFDVLIRSVFTVYALLRLPRHVDAQVRSHLALGDHLSAIGVMQVIAAFFDQLLLQRIVGYTALANFSVATILPEQIKDFVNSIGGVMLRRFSKHGSDQPLFIRALQRHFWIFFLFSACVVIGYALLAPWIFPLLFPAYADHVWLSIAYAIGLLAMPALVGLNAYQAFHRLKELWIFHTVGSVLTIACNVLLIPTFGAWGAVWSKTSTRLINLCFAYPRSSLSRSRHDHHGGVT